MALKLKQIAALPKSAGKGGGKVNEELNAFADEVLTEDWSEVFNAIDEDGNEVLRPVRIEDFPTGLVAGQIVSKVNGMIDPGKMVQPFYLVAKNQTEDGEPCTVEREVKRQDTGEMETTKVANALYAVPGIKPVQNRKRKSDGSDVDPADTEEGDSEGIPEDADTEADEATEEVA